MRPRPRRHVLCPVWGAALLALGACAQTEDAPEAPEAPEAVEAPTTVESAEAPQPEEPEPAEPEALEEAPETPDLDDASTPDGFAPIPYSAAQIRDAHPSGTRTTFRIQREGAPAILQRSTFTHSTARETSLTSTTATEDGEPVGPEQSGTFGWDELRRHAAFPAAITTRSEARVTVEAGTYECWLYVVAPPSGPVNRFWFARSKPGPPVLMTTEVDGKETMRMELIEYARP